MSLLDDRRHTVTFYPEKLVTNSLGDERRVPDLANGQVAFGRVGSPASTEVGGTSQEVRTTRVFRCREFPAGAFAAAKWRGVMYDVQGEPLEHDGSDFTHHFTVTLIAQTARAVV